MKASHDPTIAAVQAAQRQRRDAAEACEVRYQNLLQTDTNLASAYERYLVEGKAIDSAFEHQIEPWKQHFLASNPGLPLPQFLMPGFKSYAALQRRAAEQTDERSSARPAVPSRVPAAGNVGHSLNPTLEPNFGALTPTKVGKSEPHGSLTDRHWAWIIAGVVIFTAVSLFAAVAFGGSGNSNKNPGANTPVILTLCETAMRTASREPDSTLAEPLIMYTTQACGSKLEWIAAVKRFPGAMGMMDYTNAQAAQSWEIVCYDAPAAPAC